MEPHEVDRPVRLFIDLDGTLLDASRRLHGLFSSLVPRSDLTLREYWDLKRSGLSHELLLSRDFGFTPEEVERFERKWLDRIEDPQWLEVDRPYPGVADRLSVLSSQHELHLLTARQRVDMVHKQISAVGWEGAFRTVMVTGGIRSKSDLLREVVSEPTDWLVGDTGADVQAGRMCGLRTAVVTQGFLSREVLIRYAPDRVYPSFAEFEPA